MKYLLEQPVKGTIGTEKYKSTIKWRNGVLITDEPEKIGGKDEGPDPFTLLLSSLVACTLSTMRMYIDHKGLEISEITIDANLYYSIDQSGMTTRIERKISIQDSITPEVRERLLEVAETCPVSKILKGNVKIITNLEEIPLS